MVDDSNLRGSGSQVEICKHKNHLIKSVKLDKTVSQPVE